MTYISSRRVDIVWGGLIVGFDYIKGVLNEATAT